MLRKWLLTLCLLLGGSVSSAQPYGHYEFERLVYPSSENTSAYLDLAYLEQMLIDLRQHALLYPVVFDSAQDQARATLDTENLMAVFDVILDTGDAQTLGSNVLYRAALLYSIAYNLDIAGAGDKADNAFQQLLALEPDSVEGNFLYGEFLAASAQNERAIPYLERTIALGQDEANFTLGINYLMLGNAEKGLEYLQIYQQMNPDNTSTAELIEAIQSGVRFTVRKEVASSSE